MIIIYSKGAIDDGVPLLYALNKQKKPITPVNPIPISISNVEILTTFQSINKDLYSLIVA